MIKTISLRVSRVSWGFSRQYRGRSSVPEPGVSRRLQIIRQDSPELVRAGVTQNLLEDLEGDFFKSREIRDEYKRETNRLRKIIAFSQIERKHFKKTPSPNMLLWSEKEQIRQLYHSEPETWTVQRLSESFPATVEVIKKLVKSYWKPDSSEKIAKHDEKVKMNWKKFNNGELDVDEEIRSHLSKFTSRRDLVVEVPSEVQTVTSSRKEIPETVSKEFLSIVKPISAEKSPPTTKPPPKVRDTYLIKEDTLRVKRIRREVTLDEMRRLSDNIELNPGTLSEAFERGKVKETGTSLSKGLVQPKREELTGLQEDEAGVGERRVFVREELPTNIRIPSDKRVKGKLYRVKNSFYTDDGEFLYRI